MKNIGVAQGVVSKKNQFGFFKATAVSNNKTTFDLDIESVGPSTPMPKPIVEDRNSYLSLRLSDNTKSCLSAVGLVSLAAGAITGGYALLGAGIGSLVGHTYDGAKIGGGIGAAILGIGGLAASCSIALEAAHAQTSESTPSPDLEIPAGHLD